MRKLLLTLLTLSSIAFAYDAGHAAEMDHSFQEGTKDPGYSAGHAAEGADKHFEKHSKGEQYGVGHEAEDDHAGEKKDKKK